MPRKITSPADTMDKWNFYVSKLEKAEFIKALVINGKDRAQSAALRALMHLYVNDQTIQNKVNDIIDEFKVYKQNGKPSKL